MFSGLMNVLVTGGPGFIGRHVVQRFLDAGSSVVSFSLPGEPEPAGWGGRARLVNGDLLDGVSLGRAAGGASIIIHLAAVVGLVGEYERQWRIIAEGTRAACAAAATGRARLVVASSIAVYGDRIQKQVCREDDGFGAWQGAYGRAKQGQETIAIEEAARHGFPLTIVRPANVFGLGGASAWGDRMIDLIRTTGGGVIGDGARNRAGLVYVENLADAIYLAATRSEAVGRTYNVCDENGATWRRFNDDMAAVAGMPPPPSYPLDDILRAVAANEDPQSLRPPSDPAIPFMEGVNLIGFDNRIDSSRIRRELGWSPKYTYDAAMAQIREQAGHGTGRRGAHD